MSISKGEKCWVVTKNGNYVDTLTSKTKAVTALQTISGFSQPPVEQKDGSIMLEDVAHFRAREVAIS